MSHVSEIWRVEALGQAAGVVGWSVCFVDDSSCLETKSEGLGRAFYVAVLLPLLCLPALSRFAVLCRAVLCYAGTPALDMPQYGGVQIMKELIPRLIGPQGSTLTDIEETCGASLIVEDSGTINVYAPTQVCLVGVGLLSSCADQLLTKLGLAEYRWCAAREA
jgi:hypothetical protein